MKTVWLSCSVPDDATADHMAQVMELLFKAQPDSVQVYETQRAAVDDLRNVTPLSSALFDLRMAAAETVHLSYDYTQKVEDADPWESSRDSVVRTVYLAPIDPTGDPIDVTLEVLFEPGTGIIFDVNLHGNVADHGRRLDPLLIDTEQLLQQRLAAAERHFSKLSAKGAYSPTSPWYPLPEFATITYARELSSVDGPRRMVATFRPGSSHVVDFRLEAPEPDVHVS